MKKAIEFKAIEKVIKPEGYVSVFLAGSIEMGKAIAWQEIVTNELNDYKIVFVNPRRDDWDSSWEQRMDNPNFSKQVNWEFNNLEECDLIIMYFDPNTISPISLLELGAFGREKKMIVCCPEGYFRKGNVDIFCVNNSIKMVDSIGDLIQEVKYYIGE